jgi:hypothetical protein
MSNGDVAYSNRFFYLRVPPRQVSPPVPSHDCTLFNCVGQGSADQPIEIYDGSSDEVPTTVLIDPSLRDSPVNPSSGTTAPTNSAALFFDQVAPPGLVPTQPAAPVETDIPVPNLSTSTAPPAYAAAPVPRPFPAPVFPTPNQLPIIPPVSDLALQSYIRYATGRPQVEDGHLRTFRSPSPILVSDVPERRDPPS